VIGLFDGNGQFIVINVAGYVRGPADGDRYLPGEYPQLTLPSGVADCALLIGSGLCLAHELDHMQR
jgi:hypothetical protein